MCQDARVDGNSSRKRRMEEKFRRYANGLQGRLHKKHLKELYLAKMSQVSPEALATMKSSEGSRDAHPRTNAQDLCAPREPEAPQQTSQSAPNPMNTIPDPSETYLAPQFQE